MKSSKDKPSSPFLDGDPSDILKWSIGASLIYLTLATFHALFGYYFWAQAGFSIGNDDAFISFRYAKNLVEHGILSFNPSDNPPVEGFSNPIYVAAAAAGYALVGERLLYPLMAVLGAIAVASTIVRLGQFALQRLGEQPALILVMSTALCPPLWIHGTSGLETSWVFLLQILLWTSTIRYAEKQRNGDFWGILVLSTGLVLLRTDGFVVPIFVALWLGWRGNVRLAWSIIGVCASAFFILMAARLLYYGLPMPLTYYVKVSGPLLDRFEVAIRWILSISVKDGMAFPLLGACAAFLIYARKIYRTSQIQPPPLEVWLVGCLLAYYLYIGGDIYRERFLIIIYPLGIYSLLSVLRQQFSLALIRFSGVVVILAQLMALALDPRLAYSFHLPKYDRWVELGKFLAKEHPDAVLATGAAGKLPYYSNLQTIDMLGLNNRHIAMTEAKGANPGHNKFDVDYILRQRPDIICSHTFSAGDLTYGLDRTVYQSAGYRLQYLVSSKPSDEPKIISLTSVTLSEAAHLISNGYNYGCIIRNE